MKQTSSVSIVIPVYNEVAHLPACLDAIAAQTVQPREVIVVDNNSTDDTAKIARRYKFVRLIRERRQGVVYARNRGFDSVRSKIIGRIDADTVIAPDWVERLEAIFSDRSIDAISGRATYHDMAFSPLLNVIDLKIRGYLARTLTNQFSMQGANMALRRSAWRAVRNSVCSEGGLHEDVDLSVHMHQHGFSICFDDSLVASLGYRQAGSSYVKFTEYVMLIPRTYSMHGLKCEHHIYSVCALAIACFLPLKILHRGYDKEAERFSLTQLFSESHDQRRVNPATFVEY